MSTSEQKSPLQINELNRKKPTRRQLDPISEAKAIITDER